MSLTGGDLTMCVSAVPLRVRYVLEGADAVELRIEFFDRHRREPTISTLVVARSVA